MDKLCSVFGGEWYGGQRKKLELVTFLNGVVTIVIGRVTFEPSLEGQVGVSHAFICGKRFWKQKQPVQMA